PDDHDPAEQGSWFGADLVDGGVQRDDEGHRGTEVGGDPVAGQHQEQQRARSGEEQGGAHREAGQQRHQRGGAEHRQQVLDAEADRERPIGPLAGRNYGVVLQVSTVAVHGPQRHIVLPGEPSSANTSTARSDKREITIWHHTIKLTRRSESKNKTTSSENSPVLLRRTGGVGGRQLGGR